MSTASKGNIQNYQGQTQQAQKASFSSFSTQVIMSSSKEEKNKALVLERRNPD
jgi:hypothetical protein